MVSTQVLDTHHTPNNSDKELLLKEKYRVSVFKSEREQEISCSLLGVGVSVSNQGFYRAHKAERIGCPHP